MIISTIFYEKNSIISKNNLVTLTGTGSSNVDDQEDLVGKMKIIMNEDEEDETSTKKTNNKNFDASSLSILSNTHSEQSDLNIESSREENIQFDPLFLQVSICIRHENDVQIDCPISQLPTCLIDIIKFINSEDGKELGMTSHKMSLITIFGHKLFRQKFHQKFDIFHQNKFQRPLILVHICYEIANFEAKMRNKF